VVVAATVAAAVAVVVAATAAAIDPTSPIAQQVQKHLRVLFLCAGLTFNLMLSLRLCPPANANCAPTGRCQSASKGSAWPTPAFRAYSASL
jgi:hypothetical protein